MSNSKSTSNKTNEIPINTSVVCSFRPSKILSNHKEHAEITSIDFDDTGDFCITSGNDESIQLYDVKQGKHLKTVYSKKYGVTLAKFTHHHMNCIYPSTKEDDTIRYLSLHDNSYIRYFRGHKGRIHDIDVSPIEDLVLSGSDDNTVRLWDLRSPNCQGLLNTPAPSLVNFDPTAVIFSVASEKLNSISLYDIRNFDKIPFSTFKISTNSQPWEKLEFANDGKRMLLSTLGNSHYVLDSFNGDIMSTLVGHEPVPVPSSRNTGHTTISQDGRFVFSGSGNCKLYIWDILKEPGPDKKLRPIKELDCINPPALVTMNPKKLLLATAKNDLTLWLPDLNLDNNKSNRR